MKQAGCFKYAENKKIENMSRNERTKVNREVQKKKRKLAFQLKRSII